MGTKHASLKAWSFLIVTTFGGWSRGLAGYLHTRRSLNSSHSTLITIFVNLFDLLINFLVSLYKGVT